jgi:hypothetical protein
MATASTTAESECRSNSHDGDAEPLFCSVCRGPSATVDHSYSCAATTATHHREGELGAEYWRRLCLRLLPPDPATVQQQPTTTR